MVTFRAGPYALAIFGLMALLLRILLSHAIVLEGITEIR